MLSTVVVTCLRLFENKRLEPKVRGSAVRARLNICPALSLLFLRTVTRAYPLTHCKLSTAVLCYCSSHLSRHAHCSSDLSLQAHYTSLSESRMMTELKLEGTASAVSTVNIVWLSLFANRFMSIAEAMGRTL